MYGIRDLTLAWIRSYLSDILQRVNIKKTLSDKQIDFGVPQGFVHVPMLYCLYITSDIIERFGLLHHSYADDTYDVNICIPYLTFISQLKCKMVLLVYFKI